jgi:hypothetical protein
LVAPYDLPASLLKNWVQAGKFQSVLEITHAEALRPLVLIGALVIIGAAGLWLVDEFGGWLLRR